MHVVIVPYPVQGMITPMMQLAKKLIAHDDTFVITFVNNRYNHERLIKANNGLLIANPQERLNLVCIEDGLPSDFDYNDIGSNFYQQYFTVQNVMFKPNLRDLLTMLTDPAPDIVIVGAFANNARLTAAELNIPSVLMWTQSTAAFNIYFHIHHLIDNGFFPFGKQSDPISYIPGIPPIEPRSFPTPLRIPDESIKLSTVQYIQSLLNYKAILFNSYYDLEKPIFQSLAQDSHSCQLPPVLPVGPLLPEEAFQLNRVINNNSMINGDAGEINSAKSTIHSTTSLLDEDLSCIQWLDTKPENSVLYVSFGSLFNPSVENIRALATGIKASRQPFLWVIRSQASINHVSELFPEGFLEENKENGLIIPWAPQLEVLSHPSIGAFVTHCGWNSALESITMGVPVITFPVSMDQPTNSKFLTDIWKIGICIAKYQETSECLYIDSKDVEMAITTILKTEDGQKMRDTVKTLKEAAIEAVGSGGTSHSAIAKFINILQT